MKEHKLRLNVKVEDGIWKLDNAIIRIENGEVKRIDNGNWNKITDLS